MDEEAYASALSVPKTCSPALRQSAIGLGSEIALGSLSSWKVHRHRPRTFSPPNPMDDCSGSDVSFSPCFNVQESDTEFSVKAPHQSVYGRSDVGCDDGSCEQFFEPMPEHYIPQSCSIFCYEMFDVSRSPGHSYAKMFHCACLWQLSPVPIAGVSCAHPRSGVHAGAPHGDMGSLVPSPYGLVGGEWALPSCSPPSLNLVVPNVSSSLSNELPVFPDSLPESPHGHGDRVEECCPVCGIYVCGGCTHAQIGRAHV